MERDVNNPEGLLEGIALWTLQYFSSRSSQEGVVKTVKDKERTSEGEMVDIRQARQVSVE